MTEALRLAVVGHTNVGKTSLLRTLTRDVDFGEVSHCPSTTRHVEGVRLSVSQEALLTLYDTPGLEDAIALHDYLIALERSGERLDGPDKLARFLASTEAVQRFAQEAKVIRQLLDSDAGLYVIDAREPVLAKYRDELAVLAMCGRPLLPVFNFSASPARHENEWREVLARLNLHAQISFDSVAPPQDGERRLYESLSLFLEKARPQLQRLIADHQEKRRLRYSSGVRLIAELLVDIGACRRSVAAQADLEQKAVGELQQAIRQREQRCVAALLRLYAFRPDDALAGELPLLDGRWDDDLFNPETLKKFGVTLSSGVATGAAAGAGIDLLVGGVTLGTAALLGAIVGATAQTARHYGDRVWGWFKGQHELTVADNVLRLLALRQLQLLQALDARGHAALHTVHVETPPEENWRSGELPSPLIKARSYPEWSSLNSKAELETPQRQELIMSLVKSIDRDVST